MLQGAAVAAVAMPSIARAQNKKFVLRLSHSHTSGNTALDVFATKLRDLAAAKSGGAIDVQVFANNQLGQEREIVQQLQQGITELMASGSAIWGSVAPKIQVLDLPFLFRDFDHIHKAMDGEAGPLLSKHVEERAGVRPIVYFDSYGFRNVVTRNKQVKSIDDMKGLKIRTIQTTIYVKAVELMGASPTPMAFGEVYTSLQTGVIDGYEHDANVTLSQKFYEVSKYMAMTQHISGVLTLTASAKAIDTLPAEIKTAFLAAAQEAAAFQRGRAPIEDLAARDELKKLNIAINDIDRKPFMTRAEPFWASFSKEVQAEDVVKKILAV
jgi:tripartite ATP-independent transporter DctP family solute receptor